MFMRNLDEVYGNNKPWILIIHVVIGNKLTLYILFHFIFGSVCLFSNVIMLGNNNIKFLQSFISLIICSMIVKSYEIIL